MVQLFVRIDFENADAFGPGKARLLELVDECGSIRRAAAMMKMSYPHAWKLLEATEPAFGARLIVTNTGGAKGGGAKLTDLGRTVVTHYRNIEHRAKCAAAEELAALSHMASPGDANAMSPDHEAAARPAKNGVLAR